MIKVRCSICGNIYAGKIPKGGDGSGYIPRLHYRRYTVAVTTGLGPKGPKVVCPGSFRDAEPLEPKK